ncbi:hypothetical protein SCUCBS95973_000140 [Sporothrix curviconia]|uniref:Uncharacterized protein n=1 Tax=Sporothrix curviconia TaxID=1260050 RepID=A0ABP0AMB9_9PEZI
MDVTAMLNTASTAAALERNLQMIHERKDSSDEELVDAMPTPSATTGGSTAPSSMAATPLEKTPSRRSSDSRTPNRNRTPWDAGGYSLSLALDDTKKLGPTSPGSRTAFLVGGISPIPKDCLPASVATPTTSSASTATAGAATAAIYPSMATSENRVSIDLTGGSTSPRHKFSDSRSSFSSAYTNASSTNNSVAHSRISSLSTVSENQPLAALITDFSHLETRISEPRMGLGLGHTHHSSSSHQNQLKLQQYAFATSQSSPSREACRPDADFQPESPTPVRSRYDKSIGASPEPSPRSPGRAQSPSDAMLIQRPGQPDEAEEAGYFRNYKR